MDNPRVGSLNSLADYGLGESDIEDSDDEVEGEGNRVTLIPARPSIAVAQARVKTSARLVSYDDVAEEEEGEGDKEKESENRTDTREERTDVEKAALNKDEDSEESIIEKPSAPEPEINTDVSERPASEEKDSETAVDSAPTKTNTIPVITMPQLPPEPAGRCSNKLQEKILRLLEKKHRENLDLNTSIQKRKDFRNPSIYKKLLSYLNLDETGSNYPKSLFDPTCWTEESFYENLSKAQKEAYDKKEKEKAKQARTHVEFVSGTKKTAAGEEPKKRKSKWDQVSTAPAPPVKTATPPTKVGVLGPGVASTTDVTSTAKKPKLLS